MIDFLLEIKDVLFRFIVAFGITSLVLFIFWLLWMWFTDEL